MLQIGTKAPYFEGVDENGKAVSLKDFLHVGVQLVNLVGELFITQF